MNEKEKEFRERLEKEQKEKERKEKERKEQKEKKQKEKEYQNWKNAQLLSGKSAEATQPIIGWDAGKKEIFLLIGIILIVGSLLFFGGSFKNLSLSVEEGLKKIEIAKAMEICRPDGIGGIWGGLESALIDLSEDEGMSIYIDESFKRHYYHIIGWGDGSKSYDEERRAEQDGCTYLINNDEKFSKEFDRVWGKKLEQSNAFVAAEREKEEADRVRFAPQLEKWDNKLSDLGSGGLRNYLQASAATENLIRQGAAYSLTGASRGAVQSVSCDATDRSFWSRGVPTGWWSCLIDFEGSDYALFSVEFTENSWRGVPDRGRQAGTDIKNIEIPQDLIEWLGKQE
jgi:hypothetical protein